jgi:hypothetical protein
MRVLVIGGRDFDDPELLNEALDRLHRERGVTALIHGDARGADRLAGEWATANGIPVETHPADWKRCGRGAGPMRNRSMLDERPDLLVAFPGGKGTADMVRRARKAGLDVIMVEGAQAQESETKVMLDDDLLL